MTPSAARTSAQSQLASLTVEIEGLRDAHGVVRLCLTARRDDFPDCRKGGALSGWVKTEKRTVRFVFKGVTPGTYAIAAFHDANLDTRLNTSFGIPREGFAFSRNPPIRPRAPRFDESDFTLSGDAVQRIKMRYLF